MDRSGPRLILPFWFWPAVFAASFFHCSCLVVLFGLHFVLRDISVFECWLLFFGIILLYRLSLLSKKVTIQKKNRSRGISVNWVVIVFYSPSLTTFSIFVLIIFCISINYHFLECVFTKQLSF